jgi:hypothetical protein
MAGERAFLQATVGNLTIGGNTRSVTIPGQDGLNPG